MSDNVTSADNQQGSLRDPSETTRRIPQVDKELAMLLGLLFTDGCISPKKANSWRIYFSNKSKILINLFRDCIIKIFNCEPEKIRLGYTSDGLYRAIVNSKQIGQYLVNHFGTFRTLKFKDGKLPKAKLPIALLLNSGFAPEFLQAAFSCDGGVSLYTARRNGSKGGTKWLIRTIFISCAHKKLRDDYNFLLKQLGIKGRNIVKDGKIKIETEKDIKKFYKTIGFIEGVEATGNSKFWEGHNKQKVLELMINSYSKPSAIYNLPKFKLR